MYEELIKRLRETSIDFGELDHVSVMMIEAADTIEGLYLSCNNLVAVVDEMAEDLKKFRWIPVTERLPENRKRVLAVHELVERFPWVEILRYGIPDDGISAKELCFYYTGTNIDLPISGVTHWMPCPEPPESEGE